MTEQSSGDDELGVRICPRCSHRTFGSEEICPNYPRGRIGGICGYDLSDVPVSSGGHSPVPTSGADLSSVGDVKRAALTVFSLVAILLTAGTTYEQWCRWRAPKKFPFPGEMVDVGGKLLHLNCTGEGAPTVILEAGAGSSSAVWMTVQPAISEGTRVCSYDRAGLGWSEESDDPRVGEQLVHELHDLLTAANVLPPYIMVGHSFGGLLIIVFAEEYVGDVVGFVFVDATDPDGLERMPPEMQAEFQEGLNATGLRSFLAATGALRIQSSGTPRDWPTEFGEVTKAFTPQSVGPTVREMAEIRGTSTRAASAGPFGDLPVVVLTAGRYQTNPDRTQEENQRMRELRLLLQSELAALSWNSDHRIVDDAAHFIQLDDPDAVIGAVRDVLTAARSAAPVRKHANSR